MAVFRLAAPCRTAGPGVFESVDFREGRLWWTGLIL